MIKNGEEMKLSANETLKAASPTLTGTIPETLADPETDRFSNDDTQFLKFHGIYQQDDRDKRKTGKVYMFMIRCRIPGGVVAPDLYLTFDRLANEYANQTLRITTRQSFQFHGVMKSGLGKLMKGINDSLSSTLAACGDVNRNVMAPPTPSRSRLTDQVIEDAKRLADAFRPQTRAYHQIWVDGVKLNTEAEDPDFVDPLYGKTYLPRKFKAAFAIPPLNDSDVYTNCLGFVAIEENGELAGYNLLVGGGMGMNHNNPATYPRMADVIGFIKPEQVEAVGKAVLTIHRDFGDRSDRKHARLKYVIAERGADWCRKEVEQRAGVTVEPAREFHFDQQQDLYGWHEQFDGKWFLGLHVLAGRIQDTEEAKLMTAIRKAVEAHRPEVRLTANQNLLLVNVDAGQKDAIQEIFAEHGIDVENQGTIMRRASLACPALPTCGLALAESERYLPDLIDTMEGLMRELNLDGEEIITRLTGCPNGCARPYMAELALVGRAPNKYQLYLGGNENSTRLARLYKQNVKTEQIRDELKALLERYARERRPAERFGDFSERVLWKELEGSDN